MPNIEILDKETIDKIAAGEVVDRPASIVKEMLENAIDAKATSVTVEIKDGGISFIRITDNGCGIAKEDIRLAFLRHATSKIRNIEDLISVSSLGFRGEALSSISAVAQVECITKTPDAFVGTRYVVEGGEEKTMEEVGAPSGTTFIIRNIFYNTPARRKFLKTAATEGSYISAVVEHIALSHPEVSIRFISAGNSRLHTAGNNKLKDIIYGIYGRDITANLLEVERQDSGMEISGFIAKPVVSRGNRNYMNYFINGRYIKSKIISSAIEAAYKSYLMQHNYPFCVLHFSIPQEFLDVNVHPSKMELRFEHPVQVHDFIYHTLTETLKQQELIPKAVFEAGRKKQTSSNLIEKQNQMVQELKAVEKDKTLLPGNVETVKQFEYEKVIPKLLREKPEPFETNRLNTFNIIRETECDSMADSRDKTTAGSGEQLALFDDKFLSGESRFRHRIIGQLFETYWLIEYGENLYIIDQHAAHEKVLFEKTMEGLKNKTFTSQMLNPPIILTLNDQELQLIEKFRGNFEELGYEIEAFGGREYAIRAVPANLYSLGSRELLLDIIDSLSMESASVQSNMISEKIASMSCKAAVKGNNKLSVSEAEELIGQLLKLENPYHCPHGRPTIISMSKYEIEKKFKRIL
ncbi:MAG: DNA mismatch repair endonuclease MutL [Lachnospiraceae bacterium]|nr:DNA mismatch repair endonuclease MutL [Lachnospiraceae bacterium]